MIVSKYQELLDDSYKSYPYEYKDLGEGMSLVSQSMWGWWKPRYLLNHHTMNAYEFMDERQCLAMFCHEDINWESLRQLPEKALRAAQNLSAHFPTFIRRYKNGVARVDWQLVPDGRYYMDEDGFGMTDDDEITIYGFIDMNCRVVVEFQTVGNAEEMDALRREAEDIISNRTSSTYVR